MFALEIMQSRQKTKYQTVSSQDEEDGFGEPGFSPFGRSSEVVTCIGCGTSIFRIKQSSLIRPGPDVRERELRLPNDRYVYLLTAFVSIGALLFGYDQGVMGVIVADARWKDLMRPENSCMQSLYLFPSLQKSISSRLLLIISVVSIILQKQKN